LARFIDLKLAIGLSETRTRDLADVLQLIQHAKLPRDVVNDLDPDVRDEYERMAACADARSVFRLATAHDPQTE
jgi:hypothetical protein